MVSVTVRNTDLTLCLIEDDSFSLCFARGLEVLLARVLARGLDLLAFAEAQEGRNPDDLNHNTSERHPSSGL